MGKPSTVLNPRMTQDEANTESTHQDFIWNKSRRDFGTLLETLTTYSN